VAPASGASEPLILTLKMDERSQEMFDRLRGLYFPPERNYLSAHLTLFHKLPGEREAEISADLREVCRDRQPLTLTATGLRSLGRGVAFELSSPDLVVLRRELAGRWGRGSVRRTVRASGLMLPCRTKSHPRERKLCTDGSWRPSHLSR